MTTHKVALITGAAKGIGEACARSFAQAGYKVAVHYRSPNEFIEKLAEEIPSAVAFQCDLAREEGCKQLFNAVKETFGRIDVLVNNAGMARDQVIPMAKPEDFDLLLASNLKPVFLLCKMVSRQMIKQRSGVIINITSVVGHTGNAGQSMYAATKAAITGLSKSISQDLAPYGIRCNCVAPGFIATAMTDALPDPVREDILKKIPLGRMGSSGEVAAAVTFLASQDASYITGSTLHVNGGMFTN
jgi:3-oxoacyl-[acyl-carrier protein] reductase